MSAEVENRIADGEDVSALIPSAVEAYIRENRLYGAEG